MQCCKRRPLCLAILLHLWGKAIALAIVEKRYEYYKDACRRSMSKLEARLETNLLAVWKAGVVSGRELGWKWRKKKHKREDDLPREGLAAIPGLK